MERRFILKFSVTLAAAVLLMFIVAPRQAYAYKAGAHSVLSHDVAKELPQGNIIREAMLKYPNVAAWGATGPDIPANTFDMVFDRCPWFERYHYDRVGSFTAEILRLALASGDEQKIAWAGGWVTHVMGDLACHGIYVNPDPIVEGVYQARESTHDEHGELEAWADKVLFDEHSEIGSSYSQASMQATFNSNFDYPSTIILTNEASQNVYGMDPGYWPFAGWMLFFKDFTLDTGFAGLTNWVYSMSYPEAVAKLEGGVVREKYGGPYVGMNRRTRLDMSYNHAKEDSKNLLIAAVKGDYSGFSDTWNLDASDHDGRPIGELVIRIKTADNEWFTGTDNDIVFGLQMDDGHQYISKVLDKSWYNDFERGDDDYYYLYVDDGSFYPDRITEMTLHKKDGVIDDEWKPYSIDVYINGKLFTSNIVNQWLSEDHPTWKADVSYLANAEVLVKAAYNDMFGRQPSPSELQDCLDKMQGGMKIEDIRDEMRKSPEFDSYARALITLAYSDWLWREPDPGGLEHYFDLMKNKGQRIGKVEEALGGSREFRDIQPIKDDIKKAYREITGGPPRPQDTAKRNGYMKMLRDNKGTLVDVRADITHDFRVEQITTAYRTLLKRDPTQVELNKYIDYMNVGKDISWVEEQLRNSQEYIDLKFNEWKESQTIIPHVLQQDETYNDYTWISTGLVDLNGHKLTINGGLMIEGGILDVNGGTLEIKGGLSVGAVLNVNKGQVNIKNELFITYQGATVDINLGTLSVTDIRQPMGTIDVNGGTIKVNGSYILGNVTRGYNNEYTYYYGGTGILKMVNENDNVTVNGSFITTTFMSHDELLTNGTLSVAGDFIQATGTDGYLIKESSFNEGKTKVPKSIVPDGYEDNSYANFKACGNHKVILCGDGSQKVSFATPGLSKPIGGPLSTQLQSGSGILPGGNKIDIRNDSRFNILEITNNVQTMVDPKSNKKYTPINFEGVAVLKLFQHNNKGFTLLDPNRAYFVDYDSDGLKDNLDPHPTYMLQVPYVSIFTPAENAQSVDLDAVIKLKFDQQITAVNPNDICIKDENGNLVGGVGGSIESDKTTLTISHDPFYPGTQYTVVVTEGAVKSTKYSTADKVYVNPTIKWSFKTESANVYYLETYMATQFPTWENGENGVYLQYKDKQNNYTDLKYSEKYEAFISDGKNPISGVSIPAVASLNANTPKIVAIPYVDPTGINPKDAIMRVRLDGNYGNVKISGEAAPITGKLRYYIYLGRNNYNKPIWQSTTGGKFELTAAYKDGDELFFAVGSTSGSSKNTGIPALSTSGSSVFNGAGLPAWIGLRLLGVTKGGIIDKRDDKMVDIINSTDPTHSTLDPENGPWTGVWESGALGTIVLQQIGPKVKGVYNEGHNQLEGILNGDKLTGKIHEGDKTYSLELNLSASKNSLSGKWINSNKQGITIQANKRNIPSSDVITEGVSDESWTGVWYTTYGTVVLYQAGSNITGSFSTNGSTIEGTIEGNVLKANVVERGLPGQLELQMDTGGVNFSGRWKYNRDAEWTDISGFR